MTSVTHDELTLQLEVTSRLLDGEAVCVLELRDPTGRDLPAWTAGAHIDVRLDHSLVRQYSLCGNADDRSVWRIGVLLEPQSRGGSRHIHTAIRPGTEVTVVGPRNNFALEPASTYVFIAGGIGITAILPMIAAAEAAGSTWRLHYGGRHRSSMAFLNELAPYADRVHVHPQDEVGLMDLPSILGAPRADTLIYCCGPEPLLTAVSTHAQRWPPGALHVERFAPKRRTEPVLHETFEVELARTGVTLAVPLDKSILQVAEAAGAQISSSCLEGTCGTCETGVLEGLVDHRDSLLTPEEQAANDVMFVCVSRAACSRLVLDL